MDQSVSLKEYNPNTSKNKMLSSFRTKDKNQQEAIIDDVPINNNPEQSKRKYFF